jgi:hypothetical protein
LANQLAILRAQILVALGQRLTTAGALETIQMEHVHGATAEHKLIWANWQSATGTLARMGCVGIGRGTSKKPEKIRNLPFLFSVLKMEIFLVNINQL